MGSIKGTQAIRLAEKHNLVHISTGDLFRYELNNLTELADSVKVIWIKGQLVPDEVTVNMLK
jgi:adenylate kinase